MMEQLQNKKTAYPTFAEETFREQDSQEGFLDLQDILYPQRKEPNQSNNCIAQESVTIQIPHQTTILPENQQMTLPSRKEMAQLQQHITQTNPIFENQTKNQRKVHRCRQSSKHNFPKHLVRKIKDLMKKVLNLKKKGKIEGVGSWRTLYFYFFHQNLRKYENIEILHLFLQHKDQASSLQNEFKQQAERHGMQREISLEFLNSLRLQLRKTLIEQQSYLFSLIEKGQIGRKQEFIKFIKQFLHDIQRGIVRPTHK